MTGRLIQMSGIVVDMVYRVDAVPMAGQEANVRSAHLCVGGGFNAMVAARRAGRDVAFAGTLGIGPLTDTVLSALDTARIPHIGGRHSGLDQGSCTVLVDDTGERTFIGLPGADGIVTDTDLATLDPGSDDWILQSGYALSYPGSGPALAAWHRARGPEARVMFDPGPRVAAIPADRLKAIMDVSTWISANAAEAEVLTGQASPEEAARSLAANRPATGGAIVRVGADGAWLAQPGTAPRHVAGHWVRAIDTNGAGDAHIGYFIAALASGTAPLDALRMANIAAALSTTQEGPSTAPHPDQVRALMPRASNQSPQHGAMT